MSTLNNRNKFISISAKKERQSAVPCLPKNFQLFFIHSELFYFCRI